MLSSFQSAEESRAGLASVGSAWQFVDVAMRKEQNKYEVCGAADVYPKQSESAERMKVVQEWPGEERITSQEGERTSKTNAREKKKDNKI